LTGCFGAAPKVPADHYYRLVVETPKSGNETKSFPGTLSIVSVEGDGLLRDRPILFTSADEPLRLRQHNYHYWSDPPTRLIQREMARYLRTAGIANSVVTPEMQINPDFELVGRLKRLERVLGDGRPAIATAIEIGIVRLSDRKLMIHKTYTVELPTGDDSVNASVTAINKSLAQIFQNIRADAARAHHLAQR